MVTWWRARGFQPSSENNNNNNQWKLSTLPIVKTRTKNWKKEERCQTGPENRTTSPPKAAMIVQIWAAVHRWRPLFGCHSNDGSKEGRKNGTGQASSRSFVKNNPNHKQRLEEIAKWNGNVEDEWKKEAARADMARRYARRRGAPVGDDDDDRRGSTWTTIRLMSKRDDNDDDDDEI
jgi:hypothetical protein